MSIKRFTKEEALWKFLATYIIAIYMIFQNPFNSQNWLVGLLLIAFGTASSLISTYFKLFISNLKLKSSKFKIYL